MEYIGIDLLNSLDKPDNIKLENHDRIIIYVNDKAYTLSESKGKLEVRVEGEIILHPRYSNSIYLEEK